LSISTRVWSKSDPRPERDSCPPQAFRSKIFVNTSLAKALFLIRRLIARAPGIFFISRRPSVIVGSAAGVAQNTAGRRVLCSQKDISGLEGQWRFV
jgi:hypothetical protein